MALAMVAAEEFTAQQFIFRCRVAENMTLQAHKGSALRGAFFHALRQAGCSQQQLPTCHPCALKEVCPVSFLLATVDEAGIRGADVPRPFVVQPPLDTAKTEYAPDERFTFGLTLFAHSVNFLPVMLLAVQFMEREGLGLVVQQKDGRWRRGTIKVDEIVVRHPLKELEQQLLAPGGRLVRVPEQAVTQEQVAAMAEAMRAAPDAVQTLAFDFLTPTRITEDGRLVRLPSLAVLAQRLIERLSSLSRTFASEIGLDFDAIMAEAQAATLLSDNLRWVELKGYSTRQDRAIPLSGFMGKVSWAGHFDALLPLFIWGQVTHVGKDATKGNGLYTLTVA